MNSEKYILNVRELHFGHIRETFRAGAVIEKDAEKNTLTVDGRTFGDTRDLDILKSQAGKNPTSPWILPFSEKNQYLVSQTFPRVRTHAEVNEAKKRMDIVQDDSSSEGGIIDIRNTQVGKNKKEAKEAERAVAKEAKKKGDMPVEAGYVSAEARLKELAGKTDPSSIAERAQLKMAPAKMDVVQDDSLGDVSGKGMAMNAGQSFPSRSDMAAKTAEAQAKAEARKAQTASGRAALAAKREAQKKATQSKKVASVSDNVKDVSSDAALAQATGASTTVEAEPEPKIVRKAVLPQDVSTDRQLSSALAKEG